MIVRVILEWVILVGLSQQRSPFKIVL
jgi:hypothetical protein